MVGQGWRYADKDILWLGGESDTLLAFDRLTRRWTEHQLDVTCVTYPVEALAGQAHTVWVAGERGVARYDPRAERAICYTASHGMMSDQVTQIVTGDRWVYFLHPWEGLWHMVHLWGQNHDPTCDHIRCP